MDTFLLLTCVSAFLALILYLVTKFFAIKEYSEKKRKGMFDWVSTNLFDAVYEPLKESAEEVSTILNPYGEWEGANKDYRKDVLLFSSANFMHYVLKNQEKVGNYIFLTQYELSNEYLRRLSGTISSVFKQIYSEPILGDGNLDESTTIKLQILATYGKVKDYADFKSLIAGDFPHYDLQDLPKSKEKFIDFWKEEIAILERINLLKRTYAEKGYLSREDSENYSKFVDMTGEIFNENDHEQRWTRAKLYAYCALFNKLLHYEIHRMYDTWYVGYPETLDLNELFYTIDRVFEITESKEEAKRKFLDSNPKEKYIELCDLYDGLYTAEQTEIETTKAIIASIRLENPKTLEEVKKKRDVALDRIQRDIREIEKYGFIVSREEISALYDISLDKNKLFDDKKSSKNSN
jgi:hypothetical protein